MNESIKRVDLMLAEGLVAEARKVYELGESRPVKVLDIKNFPLF